MKKISATAFAPATTGNVGVGFDILGIALNAVGDQVTVTKTSAPGSIEIVASPSQDLPMAPEKNTATAGLIELIKDQNPNFGFKVKIVKGIALGSGMGGSAASAVAGIFAANALLNKPLTKLQLLKYALIGEAVASGSNHGDNVAPCLFGGLMLIGSKIRRVENISSAANDDTSSNLVSLPFPSNLVIVVVSPRLRLDTKEARQVLKSTISLKDHVAQSASLAGFIAGCFQKDAELIKNSFADVVIEPQRAHLIKGFYAVKKAALVSGALGCTISGAGPAIFAITKKADGLKIKRAMIAAFNDAGAGPAKGWVSAVNKEGAHLV